MGTSLPPDTAKTRISRNIDKMAAQGASESEIEEYLQSEGVAAKRPAAESTGVHPRASTPAPDGAKEGVLDQFLNMATAGLHPKIQGAGEALVDLAMHGTGAHPINTYTNAQQATRQRMQVGAQTYPNASAAANATGFFGTLAAEAPLRALAGIPQATEAAIGSTALRRVAQSAKRAGATGTVVSGLASDGDAKQRLKDMTAGGLAGALFGGGGQAIGEAGGRVVGAVKRIARSAETKGAEAANAQLIEKLHSAHLEPSDLLVRAQAATSLGSPAHVAHLGGSGFDPLTYVASSSTVPGSERLRENIAQAQRGEHGLLQRGITAMSNVPDNAAYRSEQVLQRLGDARSAGAAGGYPRAYNAPPIRDQKILDIIKEDPDLSEALTEGIGVMQREQQLNRIQGRLSRPVANPLDAPNARAHLTPQGEAFQKLYPDVSTETLIQKGFGVPGSTEVPELPVQALDYMKQGADIVFERGVKKGRFAAHDANIIRQKVDAILRAVDDAVPEYGRARGRYAEQSRQIEGATAGVNALQQNGPTIAQHLAALESPAARSAYRTTATSELRDELSRKKYGANLTGTLFDTPDRDAQLLALYGRGGRSRFDPYVDQGRTLNRVAEESLGNSKTEPRAEARRSVNQSGDSELLASAASPRRAFFNLPGKAIDAHQQRVRAAMLRTLSHDLSIPADSPELSDLVEKLYDTIQATTPPDANPFRPVQRAAVRGSGLLAGFLNGGGSQ